MRPTPSIWELSQVHESLTRGIAAFVTDFVLNNRHHYWPALVLLGNHRKRVQWSEARFETSSRAFCASSTSISDFSSSSGSGLFYADTASLSYSYQAPFPSPLRCKPPNSNLTAGQQQPDSRPSFTLWKKLEPTRRERSICLRFPSETSVQDSHQFSAWPSSVHHFLGNYLKTPPHLVGNIYKQSQPQMIIQKVSRWHNRNFPKVHFCNSSTSKVEKFLS